MPTFLVRRALFGLIMAALIGCSESESPDASADIDGAAPPPGDASMPDPMMDGSTPPPPPPPDGSTPLRDAGSGMPPTGPLDSASVFFSGHSLININSPTFFEQLAQSEGRTVSYQLQMGLGSPMSVRLACPRSGQQADGSEISYYVLDELQRSGVYDTLILTERHDILDAMLGERSTAMARRFRDAFNAGNPSGRPFLFESWWYIDRGDPEAFQTRAARELVAWECIASKVNESRGDSPPMIVVPAGQMIAEVTGDIVAGRAPGLTSLGQLFQDDVHLTPEGNYLIALLHYGVAYRRTPVGLTHSGLRPLADAPPSVSAELAGYFQAVAGRYVERTFEDAARSQRSDAECVTLLDGLCEAQNGPDHWSCRDVADRFRDTEAAVPTITDGWCRR